jgi:HD-GYP domain-containing protein (c-di-GMP phosphodiesterase class II)
MTTKSIPIQDLRVGMYVAKLDVSWFRSPFLRHSFLLEHEEQIAKLRRAGVTHVQIDPSRGLDVDEAGPTDLPDNLVDDPMMMVTPLPVERPKPLAQLNTEYAQAKVARKQLEQTVHTLYSRISEQGTVDPRLAAEAIQEVTIVARTLPNSAIFMALSQHRGGDSSLSRHALSVCTLSLVVGQSFGYNPLELHELATAALLHDIGLIHLPQSIVRQSANTSRPLPERDRQTFESHPRTGVLILEKHGGFETKILQLIGEHHVRLDNSGYPTGTLGEFTSERSRILMIADYYDELITGFGGASPLAPHQALQRLYREAQDGALDGAILSRFIKLVGIYPVHSRVRLNTQERAVVTQLNPSALHQPVVTVTHTSDGTETVEQPVIDLSHQADMTPERSIDSVLDDPGLPQNGDTRQAA